MKITRSRLKRIIKEELQNVLKTKQKVNEAFPSSLDDVFPSIKGDDDERALELARDADRKQQPGIFSGEYTPDPLGIMADTPDRDNARAEDEARRADREANPQDPYGNIPTPPAPSPTPPPPAPARNLGPVFYRKLLNVMGPQDLKRYGRNRKGRGNLSYGQWIAARRALAKGGYEALTSWMKGQDPRLSRVFLDTQNELQGGAPRGPSHDYIGNM